MKTLLTILFSSIFALSAFAYQPVEEDMVSPFLKEFSVYPNPTSGNLTLTMEMSEGFEGPVTLKVYSLIGQEMMKENIAPFSGVKQMRLDLSSLPKGLYMVEISNGDKSRVKRISVI